MSEIELIVRGIFERDGKILLAHTVGAENTFLPGGHIEFGESARDALIREFFEETGEKMSVQNFVGAVEHKFANENGDFHEINLLFIVDCDAAEIQSQEKQLEFSFHSIDELHAKNLQPSPLLRVLPEILRDGKKIWASTIEKSEILMSEV